MDYRVARLARLQHGLITRRQALDLGVSSDMIRERLRTRRWEKAHCSVYVVAGTPPSDDQAVLAAVLACGAGAAASHRTAAVLWRLRGVRSNLVEVTVPVGRTRKPCRVRVYRSRTIGGNDVSMLGPIPVTAPARTLVDLASVLTAQYLEDALDDALQRKLVTPRKLGAYLDSARRGVAGVSVLRELMAARTRGHAGESAFENRLRRLLESSGLPTPVPQYVVRDDEGRFIARVDLAYPKAKVAIEFDGYAYHAGRREFERDRDRQNRLINAGWRVLRFTSRHRPATVVATVRASVRT